MVNAPAGTDIFKKMFQKQVNFRYLAITTILKIIAPMKKTLLSILALLVCAHVFAQSKSQILLYGNLGGSFTKNEWGQKTYYGRITPGVGYHITDRLAVGIQGMYGMNGYQDSGIVAMKRNSSNWAVGPFVRYTQPLGEMVFLFGQLDLGYGKQIAGTINGVKLQNMDVAEVSANFYPSVGLNLHNGFALNFAFGGLNYKYTKSDVSPDAGQQVNLNFGQAIQIGVSKFFGGYGRDALRNKYR